MASPLNAVAARDFSRRASRLARELNAAVGQVADQLDADVVGVIDIDGTPNSIQDLLDLLYEASRPGPVTVTVTRPSSATTAP
jgi:hypothetical protein